jgi:hypothetical protein
MFHTDTWLTTMPRSASSPAKDRIVISGSSRGPAPAARRAPLRAPRAAGRPSAWLRHCRFSGTAATTSPPKPRSPRRSPQPIGRIDLSEPQKLRAHAGPGSKVEPCRLASASSMQLESYSTGIGNPVDAIRDEPALALTAEDSSTYAQAAQEGTWRALWLRSAAPLTASNSCTLLAWRS